MAKEITETGTLVQIESENYSPAVKRATQKARWRLLPFLLLMYVIAFIDRSNIGFAQEEFEASVGISSAAYAFGAGLFFVGYAVFEVPSNLAMHKVGARWWMARIMVTWGIVSTLFMFTNSVTMFYILRILLGVAEAGFFPGVILYLTYWFPRRKRGQATSLFYLGLPLANMIGNPLSGALLELNGVLGLAGHQWMFLVEGLSAVVVGIIALYYLTDRPAKAKWLTEEEKTELQAAIDIENDTKEHAVKLSWWKALINPRVLYFCFIYFTIQIAVYGLTFFLPKQVAAIVGQKVGFEVGLLVAIPWTCAFIVTIFMGRQADKSGKYRDISAVMLALSGVGLLTSAFSHSSVLSIAALCLAAIGFVSAQPLFWNIPTSYLSGAALASGVGLINGLGNLGGFLAPILRADIVEKFSGNESAGLVFLALAPFAGAIFVYCARFFKEVTSESTTNIRVGETK